MSLINDTALSESAITENYDMNVALHELQEIQESALCLENRFVYEAEMVPVFRVEGAEDTMYCVEADQFKKFAKSNNYTIEEACDELFKSVFDQCEDCDCKEKMGVIFDKQDIHGIDCLCKSDPSKFNARCEQVMHHRDVLRAIQNEGFNIVMY